jgi:hypothetical protein
MAAPAFDAVSTAGSYSAGSTPATFTLSITAAANATVGLVYLEIYDSVAASEIPLNFTYTVTWGGQTCTYLCGQAENNSTANTNSFSVFLGIMNPPTGAQTVSVSVGQTSQTLFVGGRAFSYTGVGSIGAATTVFGNGTALSQTVSSATGGLIVQAFSTNGGSTAPTSYSGTSRATQISGDFTNADNWIVGDVAGAASVTITATATAGLWDGLAVWLLPIVVPASPCTNQFVGPMAMQRFIADNARRLRQGMPPSVVSTPVPLNQNVNDAPIFRSSTW